MKITKTTKKGGNNFKSKTVHGLKWSILSRILGQGFNFIIGIILARLLGPHAYGLIGIIMIFTGFARIYNDLGFGPALIHKQDPKSIHFNTIFWVNILFGFILTGILCSLAHYIAIFFKEPILKPLILVISVDFSIGSFGIIQRTLLQKKMDFKRLAMVKIGNVLIGGVTAILMAFYGYGVWSLVAKSVLGTLIGVIILWVLNTWRPSFKFSTKALKEIWGFSINLLGFQTINYWVRNGDDFLIGRFLSTSALGIYSKAYSLMLFPLSNISRTIGKVMFPAFSSIKTDKPRVGSIYLRMIKMISLITFPMMLGLAAVSKNFVIAVFGGQWSPMIPVLQLLALIGVIQSIGTMSGNLYKSQGRTDLQFKVGSIKGAVGVVAIVIGTFWGGTVTWVAIAYAVFTYIGFYPSIYFATSTIELKAFNVIKALSPAFFCSLTMGILVYAIVYVLPNNWPFWQYLGVQIILGIFLYTFLIQIFNVSAFYELKIFIARKYNSFF